MPGKCYHQSPMMSIVHSDVPNHPHVQWKLLMSPNRTRVELYNLTADVAEFVTVDAPDVVAFLAPLLEEWEASMPVHTPPTRCASTRAASRTAAARSSLRSRRRARPRARGGGSTS